MARYQITLNSGYESEAFVGFDELGGPIVESTMPESLGMYAKEWQVQILKDLEPGETKTDGVMTYDREW